MLKNKSLIVGRNGVLIKNTGDDCPFILKNLTEDEIEEADKIKRWIINTETTFVAVCVMRLMQKNEELSSNPG